MTKTTTAATIPTIQAASRISEVNEYFFVKKLEQINQMNALQQDPVINLGIGNPDLPPPDSVLNALIRSADQRNSHGYQPYRGIQSLRSAFATYYQTCFNVHVNPETEVLPLMGSKEGIFHLSMTFLEAGDEVLVPNPAYPAYANCAKLAGAKVRYFELTSENKYLPDLTALEKTDLTKVKMMWLNYPNMPTGATADEFFFRQLSNWAERHEILICHDNPYAHILNENPLSALQRDVSNPWMLELCSLSKQHHMAGFRIGAMIAHSHIVREVLKLKSNMDSGMYLPIQMAGIEALLYHQKGWFSEINAEYQKRKALAVQILKRLSCQIEASEAGLFVWARVPKGYSGETLSEKILHDCRIFITPGFIFGSAGHDYLRISLCVAEENFLKAVDRINHINFLA